MTKDPNLYRFATKELAQDATIAYMLAWAAPEYQGSHPRLHALGHALLRALVGGAPTVSSSPISELASETCESPVVESIEVKTQVSHIDVAAHINKGRTGEFLLLIEDKVNAHEHSNQIERYIEVAMKHYPGVDIVPVFLKTGNSSRASLPRLAKCGRFMRGNFLCVLGDHSNTGNAIVDNFHEHLDEIEKETNSFRTTPVGTWKNHWKRYEGLYMALERELEDRGVGWDYVANPAGGFLYFTFGGWDLGTVTSYFQINSGFDGTRLTARLANWGGRVTSREMWKVFGEIEACTRTTNRDLRAVKAGRFRGGQSAAVVEFRFANDSSYVATMDDGLVDMAATVGRLRAAQALWSEFVQSMR